MTTGVHPSKPPFAVADLLARVRAAPWLQRFTLMNRLLLAMAFLPTGLVKLAGRRFTTLPVDDPVGFFLATRDFLPMSQAPAFLGIGLLAMALVIGGGVAGAVRGGPQS